MLVTFFNLLKIKHIFLYIANHFLLLLNYIQNAFIGMDIPNYENQRVAAGARYNYSDFVTGDDIPFDEDYFEVILLICLVYK